jgi:enoyl-CoA hydratase
MSNPASADTVDDSSILRDKSASVVYEKKGSTACVTVSRPQAMNALNKATIAELIEAMTDARDDPEVKGVIVTGAGKAFVAGADINELALLDALTAERSTAVGQ